ncbi:ornithine cyclodeaminase family protein [Aestuariivirga litoralis]|uniref:ornithine cyclodeaminase family protein n=1 Tax=Aestuariivirga litoralis TaxID=2650924 RepID=UPI0018C7A67A|nr:ornithine cyclodeaminase family protein [Aestuariivirga litoralis]
MKVFTAADLAACSYGDYIEALRTAFQGQVTAPQRFVDDTGPATTLLIMPAWDQRFTGIKTVTVKTDNGPLGHPTVQASYLLIDNETGAPVAVMDGTELTRRRTAAASALAADYLAAKTASTLLLVGAGALAPHFARAHAAVRPIKRVMVYNRTPEKAVSVAQEIGGEAISDLEAAMAEADIITGITSATGPVIKGAWVKPGTHIDLVGAYKPESRETDAAAVAMSRVFVDTRDGALHEAGDLLMAQKEGQFKWDAIQADLFELTQGKMLGRKTDAEVTLFKSSGTALEDLAAAAMVYLRAS